MKTFRTPFVDKLRPSIRGSFLFFDQSENLLKLLIWTKAYQIVVWVAAIGFGGLNQLERKMSVN
jgi:hypothetical protein